MNSIVFFAFLVADISAVTIPGTTSLLGQTHRTVHKPLNSFSGTSSSFIASALFCWLPLLILADYIVELPDERYVSNSAAMCIEATSQSIKNVGLDPLHINVTYYRKALPVPTLFSCEAFAENITSTGLSNVSMHNISYSLLTSRLDFDIELPLVNFSVGAAALEAMLFSKTLDIQASGRVEIQRVRMAGHVHLDIGIFSGISIQRAKINFTLGNITSDINMVVQGIDISAEVNKLIKTTVPNIIKAHHAEVNELLEIVLQDFINEQLP